MSLICFGHRGAAGYAPENTLRSIEIALRLGCAWIEFDVWSVDGEVVLFHDKTLKRTTNGKGKILEKSFDYLRLLDAGAGEQIPTLEEALALIERRSRLNIELKGPQCAAGVVRILRRFLEARAWEAEDFLISSFDHSQLARVRELDQRFPIGLLSYRTSRRLVHKALDFGAASVHVALKYVDRRFVDYAHAHDLKVFVYTVNRSREIDRMRRIGVDGVFSDFPDRVLEPLPTPSVGLIQRTRMAEIGASLLRGLLRR